MDKITSAVASHAVKNFLAEQLNKKLESELKNLEKAHAANDLELIAKINETINQLKQKYSLENWLTDDASRMAKQLKFGSHISRGINPDSRGDNINFTRRTQLAPSLVGSQSINSPELDANGNAAALPFAAFVNIAIGDYKLRDLIQVNHPSLKGCFTEDEQLSDHYLQLFKSALDNEIEMPVTYELNKQILWPHGGAEAIKSDDYTCLVPLHPSVFTHHVYNLISSARYSEENKQARDNRKKKTAEQKPYLTMLDLAYVQLGGSNAQNIGQLNSRQGGRNMLLPSMPPIFKRDPTLRPNKEQTTLFTSQLAYRCNPYFSNLYAVVKSFDRNVDIRDLRKETVDLILVEILRVANDIQQSLPAGWSKEYKLAMAEKYWLDPGRAELEEEEQFREQRESENWHTEIMDSFGLWLNRILEKKFPKLVFNDIELREWRKEMKDAIKTSQRKQEGVF